VEPIPEVAIARFQANLRGDLIQPSDARYEGARKVFNGMIDRRPALIVRCAAVADVIAAVKFARETNTVVAVRGGGHGVTGNAVCNDGLVIDLSAMKHVRVNLDNRRHVPKAEPLGATSIAKLKRLASPHRGSSHPPESRALLLGGGRLPQSKTWLVATIC
jgi:hypothetical protein